MWLTSVSIRRPIFIIMFVLALVVLGFQSRRQMPQELNPKIDLPYVTIITTYSGAGPSEMETLVTEPIEKAVTSVGGLKNITSTSQDGVSTIMLELEMGTDTEAAAADVRDKVGAIISTLPKDADQPRILKLDISTMPIMTIGLAGPITPKEMRILADDVVTDRLAKVSGVASVSVTGGDQRELSVSVDKDRLGAYGIGIDKVVTAVRNADMNVPAGSIKEGARDYSVRTVGEYKNAAEIADTRLFVSGTNGRPGYVVRIGDIADVKDTVAEPDTLTRLNGQPCVVIQIQKQSGANTVGVADGIKKELAAMQPVLPAGVHPVIAMDQSKFVKDCLRDVNTSLFEGIFLVVVIVFLFLHTARATFIVAIAIPTSLMATFIPIAGFGFTQNQMVLLALSLVVGILVDDSIVVLENIERHLRLREHPEEAAINGRSEIGLAAITITMVDIVVFLPIAFMGGIVGQFFREFGVTVAAATAFSLLISFTLTPMLASRWMKSEVDKERDDEAMRRRRIDRRSTFKDRIDTSAGGLFGGLERFLRSLDRSYRGVLEWALHNRFLTVVIGLVSLLVVFAMAAPLPKPGAAGPEAMKILMPRVMAALIALVLAAAAMGVDRKSWKIALGFGVIMAFIAVKIYLPFGFGFFPTVDQGQFAVTIRTAPGTSLIETDRVVRRVEAIIHRLPEIQRRKYVISDATPLLPWTWFSHHTEYRQGYYNSLVGSGSSSIVNTADSGPQYANISATVVDKSLRKRGIDDIVEWVEARTARIPGAEMISVAAVSGGGPPAGVQKAVLGQNMDSIVKEANRVAGVVAKAPGAVDVDISYKPSRPERRVMIDRFRAAQLDMTLSQAATAVRTAIDGDDTVKFRDSGTEYPIRVHYQQYERNKTSDVENLVVSTKDGDPIFLNDIASFAYDSAPTKVERRNRQRVVYVNANLTKGAQMGNVDQAIQAGLKKTPATPGTTIDNGSSLQMMNESYGYMVSALLLAVLLVYMLMGALFESFLTPLVIMISLPQAMIGALLALLVTGTPMSIVAMIGIIMLMGLVTKNAILLVDYTNTLRSRGRGRHEAIFEAGPTRLRPILMTTLAMIGGMTPTALALSQGSETRAPMAIAVIGGLALSTLLTLIVIPVMYTIIDDVWHWFLRLFFPGAYRKSREKEMLSLEPAGFGADT